MFRNLTFAVGTAAALLAWTAFASAEIKFNRDIRPILSENCIRCHGPDKNNRKAKLRLDVREEAIKRGAFVPGKTDESELVKRINSTDPEELMPPPDSHKQLTAEQKELLKRWIAEGAAYEPHWAYITPQRPAIPVVKNKGWVRNPIDAFVLHTLEQQGIQPSAQANKGTLLRRASLDVIGLPPTIEELNGFTRSHSGNAFDREVDRLLASPRFGERMASPWLDAVRFTDTVGYHGDQPQNIFPYRDYVINAFNKNKPFDQFTIEQLAGDLLPNPTTEQKIATGFNRLNMMTREGGAQPKEYLAKYAADRVRTVSGAWLGSTMGCAECHDHKYDPFTAKDFYSMEAFFADIKQWGYYADAPYGPTPELRGFGNDHPFPPEIEVESPFLQKRIEQLKNKISALHAREAAKMKVDSKQGAAFKEWCRFGAEFLKTAPDGWLTPAPAVTVKVKEAKPGETNFIVATDGRISFSDKPRESVSVGLKLPAMRLAAIRLQVVPQEEPSEQKDAEKPGKKKRKAPVLTLGASIRTTTATNAISFYFADADHKKDRYSQGKPILGIVGGWQISGDVDEATGIWLLNKPVEVRDGSTLVLSFGGTEVSSARISITPFVSADLFQCGTGDWLRAALTKEEKRRSADERGLLNETYFLSTAWDDAAFSEYKKLYAELLNCRNGRTTTMVTEARPEPMTIRVLPRGNWQDESGEIVLPNVPHFLPQIPNADGRRLTRLDLARWLVSKENPLTARTVMNRLWKQFFGTGLSAVVDDLGGQGEPPSNADLLDWLAVEFRESGWDIKHMVRLMVTSATYQQVSNQRQDLKDIDPGNRLLASQAARRLDAELIRDNALFIAGLLNLDYGGPSSHPYQPAGYYANLQFPERDYYAEKDERQYRRGVYVWWQRTFLHPMMANFDAPAREESVCTRNLSNTPLQSLTLLNDPSFVEAARVLAQKTLEAAMADDKRRFDFIFQRALGRPIKDKERVSLEKFLEKQREHYKEHRDEADKLLRVGIAPAVTKANSTELAAWANVCRVVLNLQETITRY